MPGFQVHLLGSPGSTKPGNGNFVSPSPPFEAIVRTTVDKFMVLYLQQQLKHLATTDKQTGHHIITVHITTRVGALTTVCKQNNFYATKKQHWQIKRRPTTTY